MESGRYRVIIFAMDILDALTLNQKLNTMFEKLKSAANLKVAPGFVLKNVEDGNCRYYYACENQHFDGAIKTCDDQRGFGEQEFVE